LSKGNIESLQTGNTSSSGFFEQLSVNDETITFSFISGSAWKIKVNDAPKLRVPFYREQGGVKRVSGLKAYLKQRLSPRPPDNHLCGGDGYMPGYSHHFSLSHPVLS